MMIQSFKHLKINLYFQMIVKLVLDHHALQIIIQNLIN